MRSCLEERPCTAPAESAAFDRFLLKRTVTGRESTVSEQSIASARSERSCDSQIPSTRPSRMPPTRSHRRPARHSGRRHCQRRPASDSPGCMFSELKLLSNQRSRSRLRAPAQPPERRHTGRGEHIRIKFVRDLQRCSSAAATRLVVTRPARGARLGADAAHRTAGGAGLRRRGS